MLNFNNVDNAEFSELKQTIQKNIEKSDLDRYYLFSTDKFIKAKLFILCYRFLLNAWNLTLDGGLKDELKGEIDLVAPVYKNINMFSNYLESGRRYGKHLITEKLFEEVNKQEVTDLIDVFAILTERQNIISMTRFKGVIMDGKSGDEFNKIMRGDSDRRIYDEPEAEAVEEPVSDQAETETVPEPNSQPLDAENDGDATVEIEKTGTVEEDGEEVDEPEDTNTEETSDTEEAEEENFE